MNGFVEIYNLDFLDLPPLVLDNKYESI